MPERTGRRAADDTTATPDLAEVRRRIAELEDPRIRAVNERHGDAHGVNLTALRALAKELRSQPDLARELWDTGAADERLLALLVSRPRQYSEEDLDGMLRAARLPKVQDWLLSLLVVKSPHRDALRERWMADADPLVQSAGWALTSRAVRTDPEQLDLPGLLDVIEARLVEAPERLQWEMNTCLATLGIERPELRERAVGIGERLGVLRDYPTPPNCTSPFAPVWIEEIVRRREES